MATEVKIPHLGHTMTVAKILKWMKSIGDRVEAGEILLEIETDKVNYGIESPVSGVLKAVLVNVNDKVPVGGIVAVIGEAEEEIDQDETQQPAEIETPDRIDDETSLIDKDN